MSKTVLITGVAGFLGRHAARVFSKQGDGETPPWCQDKRNLWNGSSIEEIGCKAMKPRKEIDA
ncbi:MAG: hypothetical protein ACKVE4_03795 [Dissulfuribacterales bacterium]